MPQQRGIRPHYWRHSNWGTISRYWGMRRRLGTTNLRTPYEG
ncbi:hypothetical protein CLV54_2890 [Compostimonas suwonensis]|uniref:Uncharacterized protein n=1 Tax=Compostimonas suwonensis TaxID=1048394 RepID=A0A2M9BC63_9MICO|nr:hypothetical protein CLV54_2890 [Compostimonas suwonensis]